MNREAAGVASRLSICGEGIDTPAVYPYILQRRGAVVLTGLIRLVIGGSNPPAATNIKKRMRPALVAFVQTGRKDWAAPESVTGAMQSLINSAARVFPCLGKSRRFDSGMRRQ
jgi:hypothetical protein